MGNEVPVLLVVFNRPELTRQVIDALRQVKPTQLFVAGDGPRPDHPDDIEKCRLTKQIATEIDWQCELKTRFLSENVGCGLGVSSGISWFFDHVEYGVILEDDCVPHPHFFPFCSELLQRYADDKRIMGVNGLAPFPDRNHPYDYHFSRRSWCWGWGTWRRAWKYFSYDIDEAIIVESLEMIRAYWSFYNARRPWRNKFQSVVNGKLKTWANRFEIANFSQNGLIIAPEKNLIKNIGFGEDATHTLHPNPVFVNLVTHPLEFPLRHPPFVYADGRPGRSLAKILHRHLSFKNRCAKQLRHALGAVVDYFETMP